MRSFPILVLGLATLLTQLFAVPAEGAKTSKPAGKTIVGTITDALGRPLAGAGLELQNSAGKIVAKAKSDAEGRFSFAGLTPTVYAIVAKKPNFKTATAIVNVTSQGAKPMTVALQSEAALSLAVVAQRLNKARNSLSPETGGSVYRFARRRFRICPRATIPRSTRYCSRRPASCRIHTANSMSGVTTPTSSTG